MARIAVMIRDINFVLFIVMDGGDSAKARSVYRNCRLVELDSQLHRSSGD